MNENAKAWIEALRSGKYEQTDNTLTLLNSNGEMCGHCCLGVACELAMAAGVDITREIKLSTGETREVATYMWENGSQNAVLPEPVREWLGLRTFGGEFFASDGVDPDTGEQFDYDTSLAELNDSGATFEEIAKVIESEPEGLFGPSAYELGKSGHLA